MAAEWRCERPCCAEESETILARWGLASAGLTRRETEIAALLLARPGAIVPHATLLAVVWSGWTLDAEADQHLLRVNAARMRPLLLAHRWCLETVRGRGLRLHFLDAADPLLAAHHPLRGPARPLPAVRRPHAPHRPPLLQRAHAAEARRLRDGGMSLEGIATQLGVSRRTVSDGLRLRSGSGGR